MNLGGEQSGHMILSDYATTGDGLLAALQVLAVMVEQGRPASEVCRAVHAAAAAAEERARSPAPSPLRSRARRARRSPRRRRGSHGTGRLLIRESGTEPLIRVMAEGEDEALVERLVDELCETIAAAARARRDAA